MVLYINDWAEGNPEAQLAQPASKLQSVTSISISSQNVHVPQGD